jgi:hypothetical protein
MPVRFHAPDRRLSLSGPGVSDFYVDWIKERTL